MRKLSLASLLVLCLQIALSAKDLELATPAAGVVAMQGSVTVTEPAGAARACRPEEVLKAGWKLETGSQSGADLLLWDKSTIRVSQNTTITLVDLTQTEEGNFIRKIQVASGRVWVDAAKSPGGGDTFQVQGPQAVAAVKGTAFVVDADEPTEGTDIQVFEGAVLCTADTGESDTVGPDSEFLAPAGGAARVEHFQRQNLLAGDAWLARNWQSRQQIIAFFRSHPKWRARTINVLKMDPEVRAWLVKHYQQHPIKFTAKTRRIWTNNRPGPRPVNRNPR